MSKSWGQGGKNHWSHKLVSKLPGSPNVQAFTASMILITCLCVPKYLSTRSAPGHGMFDQEQPEEIQLQRAEERRQGARDRALN